MIVTIQIIGETALNTRTSEGVDDETSEGLFRPRLGTSSTGSAVSAIRDDDAAAEEYSPSLHRAPYRTPPFPLPGRRRVVRDQELCALPVR
jgi:hypothetical protein